MSEQECNDLMASNKCLSIKAVVSEDSAKLVLSNSVLFFSDVDEIRVDIFCTLPRILKNLLESGSFDCSATARTENELGILQLWFNYL